MKSPCIAQSIFALRERCVVGGANADKRKANRNAAARKSTVQLLRPSISVAKKIAQAAENRSFSLG